MPSFFSNIFRSSSSRRAERESDTYTPSAGYGSSNRDNYGGYGSGAFANRRDPYESSSQSQYGYEPTYPTRTHSAHASSSSARRSSSTRSEDPFLYNYRDVSPPRGAERPRRGNPWDYEERSVSPLNSSPFEQPSSYGASSRLQRSSSAREACSTYDDPYASSRDRHGFTSRAAYNPESYRSYGTEYANYDPYERPSTSGFSRRNAVRGRAADRPTYYPSEGEYDPHLGAQRRPNIDSNFQNGAMGRFDYW
jgi:hypothetical protein